MPNNRTPDEQLAEGAKPPADVSPEQFASQVAATARQLKRAAERLAHVNRSGSQPNVFDMMHWLEAIHAGLDVSELSTVCAAMIARYQGAATDAVLRLDVDLKDACATKGWLLDGEWPKYHVQRVIRVHIDEGAGSASVGEIVVPTLAITEIVAALEAQERELLPKGFQPAQFLGVLCTICDRLTNHESRTVAIWTLYREMLLEQQPKSLWRTGSGELQSIFRPTIPRLPDQTAPGRHHEDQGWKRNPSATGTQTRGRDVPVPSDRATIWVRRAHRVHIYCRRRNQMTGTNTPMPTKRVARSLVRSLATGTPIIEGTGYVHVGHRGWIDAQIELLAELAEDQDSDVVFVRGAYGAGKTHFLACVQERAQELGWATSHIECRRDQIQLDRFETVYPKILYKIRSKPMLEDLARQGIDPGECDGTRWFLDLWTRRLLKQAGYSDGPVRRPIETDDRLYGILQTTVLQRNLPGDFQRALCAYARGTLAGAADLINDLVGWFHGEMRNVQVPSQFLQKPGGGPRGPQVARSSTTIELRPINRTVSLEILRGMLWVIRQSGHKGLVLGIDEIEEIAKLSPKKRQDLCFQALREFVDNSDGDLGLRHLCTYFAATPEMFDSEDYFRRYDALSTRIEPVSDSLNYRSPLVNLDKTPLGITDCQQLAEKLRSVHGIAYEWHAESVITGSVLHTVVRAVMDARYRVAKPRLLCRILIDELERARQQREAYIPRQSHEAAVRDVVEQLVERA